MTWQECCRSNTTTLCAAQHSSAGDFYCLGFDEYVKKQDAGFLERIDDSPLGFGMRLIELRTHSDGTWQIETRIVLTNRSVVPGQVLATGQYGSVTSRSKSSGNELLDDDETLSSSAVMPYSIVLVLLGIAMGVAAFEIVLGEYTLDLLRPKPTGSRTGATPLEGPTSTDVPPTPIKNQRYVSASKDQRPAVADDLQRPIWERAALFVCGACACGLAELFNSLTVPFFPVECRRRGLPEEYVGLSLSLFPIGVVITAIATPSLFKYVDPLSLLRKLLVLEACLVLVGAMYATRLRMLPGHLCALDVCVCRLAVPLSSAHADAAKRC
jgi:hypothetical protein